MSENNRNTIRLAEAPDADACTEYRSVSVLAVVAAILGLLSLLALVDPAGWLIPVAAIVVSVIAICRIRSREAAMIGKKAAVLGLVIALLSGSAAVSRWFAARFFVERQARGIAAAWFGLLADNQPLKAHQLHVVPEERKPLDGDLPAVYQVTPKIREGLNGFLEDPLVHAVLALGKKAEIRFYECEGVWGSPGMENVQEIFSISFADENGKKKTFFASILLRRSPPENREVINWVVVEFKGGVRPSWISEEENTQSDGTTEM
jgi:hypothetical protein